MSDGDTGKKKGILGGLNKELITHRVIAKCWVVKMKRGKRIQPKPCDMVLKPLMYKLNDTKKVSKMRTLDD